MLAENTAALEALRAAYKPAQVHRQGAVPASPTTPYAVVSVSSGAAGNRRLSADHGSKSYRIAVQCFGKTSDEVGRVVDASESAFLDQYLVVDSYDTTPCDSEISTPVIRDPDGGGLLSCFMSFTFTAFPQEAPNA